MIVALAPVFANHDGRGGPAVDGAVAVPRLDSAPAVVDEQLPPLPPVTRVITYSVATRGPVRSDLAAFIANAEATYADPRGWRAAGIELQRVDDGGDFTLWLAAPGELPGFGSVCSIFYSCRIGRDVIINDDRFRAGSPTWPGALEDYRHMVVNHETGHFLGFLHVDCPAAGQPAPLMQQQSKGLDGCTPNPWPTRPELAAA